MWPRPAAARLRYLAAVASLRREGVHEAPRPPQLRTVGITSSVPETPETLQECAYVFAAKRKFAP